MFLFLYHPILIMFKIPFLLSEDKNDSFLDMLFFLHNLSPLDSVFLSVLASFMYDFLKCWIIFDSLLIIEYYKREAN